MKPKIPSVDDIRETWAAMHKLCADAPLTDREWRAVSQLTLLDRDRLEFAPDNCRWAATEAERADNLKFYRSLGTRCRDVPSIH